jgi:hypothetical protein
LFFYNGESVSLNAAYVLKCIACLNAFKIHESISGIKREPVEVGEGVDFSQRNVVLDKKISEQDSRERLIPRERVSRVQPL